MGVGGQGIEQMKSGVDMRDLKTRALLKRWKIDLVDILHFELPENTNLGETTRPCLPLIIRYRSM